jgi:hypothetical protein
LAVHPGTGVRGGRRHFYATLGDDLIAFAEHQFTLAERDDKGFTYREHLEALSARRRERHPDLDGPPLPPAARYIWTWFCDLARSTGDGPLSYSDLDAWSRMTGCRPRPWEVALLTTIDALGRRLSAEAQRRQR